MQLQLDIASARQSFLKALPASPVSENAPSSLRIIFDKLLTWNKETGWDKMTNLTFWPQPIYEGDNDLTETTSRLKQILADGAPLHY